jgi:putative spermidine/putrescine transport system permease protein
VLVFGLSRIYGKYPFQFMIETPALFVVGNVIFALPYMYRSVDIGLRAIDVHTLTEAAQSLGASLPYTLLRVIFPNITVALLSGAFLTFAIVMGEFTMASLLVQPAFGPYMQQISSS